MASAGGAGIESLFKHQQSWSYRNPRILPAEGIQATFRFSFTVNSTVLQRTPNGAPSRILGRHALPRQVVDVPIVADGPEKLREGLECGLRDFFAWCYTYIGEFELQHHLIENVVNVTYMQTRRTSTHHNVAFLSFDVVIHHTEVYEDEIMSWNESYMIPADDSAVTGLKTEKVSSGESCAICMEDFEDGHEGLMMPCRHIFHEECLRRWLQTSHYCPICRYNMPTRA